MGGPRFTFLFKPKKKLYSHFVKKKTKFKCWGVIQETGDFTTQKRAVALLRFERRQRHTHAFSRFQEIARNIFLKNHRQCNRF